MTEQPDLRAVLDKWTHAKNEEKRLLSLLQDMTVDRINKACQEALADAKLPPFLKLKTNGSTWLNGSLFMSILVCDLRDWPTSRSWDKKGLITHVLGIYISVRSATDQYLARIDWLGGKAVDWWKPEDDWSAEIKNRLGLGIETYLQDTAYIGAQDERNSDCGAQFKR